MSLISGSKKGQVIPLATLTVAVILAGGYMFLKSATDKLNLVQGTTNDWKLDLMSKKVSMLGSYLVSNSLILCKEEPFETKHRCKWAGDYLTPQIPLASFGLSKAVDPSDSSVLTFDFAVVEATLNESLPSGKSVQVSFDLVNWQKNENLQAFVGQVPEAIKEIDNDAFLVLMKVKVPYKGSAGASGGDFETFSAIKRPLAIPKLEVKVAAPCASGCPSSISENPNPECRGPQEVPEKSVSSYALTFVNTGPGPIYKSAYQRTLTFPDKSPTQTKSLPMLVGRDFIMPNDRFEISDTVVCYQPKRIDKLVEVTSNKKISRAYCSQKWTSDCDLIWCGSDFCPEGQVASSTSSSVETLTNQHLNPMASVKYDLTPGTRLTSYMAMEPNKSTKTIPSASGTVTQLVKEYTTTTTTINYIPTH